jgi:hypothetical protein
MPCGAGWGHALRSRKNNHAIYIQFQYSSGFFTEHAPRLLVSSMAMEKHDGRREPNTRKKIGEIQYAEEQAERTTGHKPPHGPGSSHEKEAAYPDRDPTKKKTGKF